MTAITFDTLAYVKTLRDAGIEERQAEAQAAALATVLKSGIGDLATKEDITRLESKLEARLNLLEERSDGRFKLLQWMLAFNLAISVALLWILIRTATA
jgi:Na+-translocating ferredoxin:NAD+ oxidoreductase RnfG subunit